MKLYTFVFYASLIIAPIISQVRAESAVSCKHDSKNFRCVKYIRNYDADTITVNIPEVHPLIGENVSVRIFGIDSAEIRGHGPCEVEAARVAKNLVTSLLKNAKQIDLANVDRDKYFRILADVYVDGKSVKDVLVKNKLAVSYDGGTKSKVNWCDNLKRVPAQNH